MIFLLWAKGILKSLGWKGIVALAVIGLIVFLWTSNRSLKAEIEALGWELITAEAKTDTMFVDAQYSPPDTVWRTDIWTEYDTISGQVDTIYEDIPGPLTGNISFDTTKVFGGDFNPLSIRVSGRFYYPEEFSHRNWLLIVPEFGKPPVVAPKRSRKSIGFGLACAVSSRQEAYLGLSGRFKRTSVALYRQFDKNVWMLGLNYAVQ